MPGLEQLASKIARSPWSVVSSVLTFVLSLWGLWEMCEKILQSFGMLWAIVAVSVLLIGVVLPFGLSFLIHRGIRRFSFPSEERFLFTDIARKWRIESSGASTAETASSYLFFREPEDEDLFDIAFSSEDYDLQTYQLHSPDATARDQEKRGKNLWKVFGSPTRQLRSPNRIITSLPRSFLPLLLDSRQNRSRSVSRRLRYGFIWKSSPSAQSGSGSFTGSAGGSS